MDEKFDSQKTDWANSLSFLPVILNSLVYLLVLYDIDRGGTLQEIIYHRSTIGLSFADMEQLSIIFWGGFYEFYAVLTQHQYGMSMGKTMVITLIPTLLVVGGRYLFGLF